jgi:hypothetical protein
MMARKTLIFACMVSGIFLISFGEAPQNSKADI